MVLAVRVLNQLLTCQWNLPTTAEHVSVRQHHVHFLPHVFLHRRKCYCCCTKLNNLTHYLPTLRNVSAVFTVVELQPGAHPVLPSTSVECEVISHHFASVCLPAPWFCQVACTLVWGTLATPFLYLPHQALEKTQRVSAFRPLKSMALAAKLDCITHLYLCAQGFVYIAVCHFTSNCLCPVL